MSQKEHVQGMECVAFHDPDRREGRDEGHAQWHEGRVVYRRN
jgi:hypothetical protein